MRSKSRTDFHIIRSVLDYLPMGVYVLNRRRKIQWVNERVMHRLEREVFAQSVGKYCYKEIFKWEKPCKDCPALKTLKTGLMEHKEIESQYKGTTRYYLVTTALLKSKEHSSEPYIIETVQDITYQKKAEEELKRINNLNTAIINNAPVSIFTLDREGKFMSVNPALASLSGLGQEAEKKLLGFNWIENPYTIKCGLADHIKKGLKGKPFELQDFPFITYRDNGQHVYLQFLGVPLKGKDGGIEGLLCIIKDTTERVKARMQLIQDAKMSVIGRLMTGVAHELNNPLATIAANSEFASELLQGFKDAGTTRAEIRELREYLNTIEEQVFRCKNIINDMIDITKKGGLEIGPINIKTCIEGLLRIMNLKKRKVRLVKEMAYDLPLVKGDLNAVKQCLANLLQNALDALEEREDKIIGLRAYPVDDMVKIEIEDNGIGIHEGVLDKIFEPFFSTKDTGRGVGLGLTLCYELISRMAGTLVVKSSLSKGSIFTITLPEFPMDSKGQKKQMIRVLIVEDEVELTKIIKKKLAKEGMEVFTAANGKEGLTVMKHKDLDVALLDIKLPDIDGVTLLGKLKETQPTTEGIMLTGHGTVDTAIQSMKLGAYDYLTKPCKLAELYNVILKAFEKKQLKEKNIVLEHQLRRIETHGEIIGESKEIGELRGAISLVSTSDVPVLILGETGTGKGLAARAIHDFSKRSANPFVTVNAGSLQENILESEFFGYKKGAFTGAQNDKTGLIEIAHKGTFFVDEVADMGSTIQAKLLRVLEGAVFRKLGDTKEITVDVRFIFATNKNIEEELETGRFRRDLFYRLNTFTLVIPPLRNRLSDIPLLTTYFMKKLTKGGGPKAVSKKAMDLLMTYQWPGNVREFVNVLERAILISTDRNEITVDDLPHNMTGLLPDMGIYRKPDANPADLRLDYMEKEHIERVLELAGGNKSKAARILGISRKNLYQKIEGYR